MWPSLHVLKGGTSICVQMCLCACLGGDGGGNGEDEADGAGVGNRSFILFGF